jgi:hypothetical protein
MGVSEGQWVAWQPRPDDAFGEGVLISVEPGSLAVVENAGRRALVEFERLRPAGPSPSMVQELDRVQTRMDTSGNIGKTLTPEQVVHESRRMREQVASGDLRSAWDRRVQLGWGVSTSGVPQADRFWLDAAPAIAALRLGLKGDPMIAMCCGVAEREQDYSDPEQRAAVEEFNKLFFG